MQKPEIKIIAVLILIIGCLACTESTTNSPSQPMTANRMLPLSIGNYWVFASYQTDPSGIPISGTNSIDSIVVDVVDDKNNESVFKLHQYTDGSVTDTMILLERGSKIYRLMDSATAEIPGLSVDYWLIADFGLREWNILSYKTKGYQVNYRDTQVNADYSFAYNAECIALDSSIYNNTKHLTKHVKQKYDSWLYFTWRKRIYNPDQSYSTDSLIYSETNLFYRNISFVENIGFGSIVYEPGNLITITTPKSESSRNIRYNGKVLNLLRFKVSN